MKRSTARAIHGAVNMTYWMENPGWDSSPDAWFRASCHLVRALPFSVHSLQKKLFFKKEPLAVNGETVVVPRGIDQVDKFMFRYPGNLKIEKFYESVDHEVGTVTRCLSRVALSTKVSVDEADIFRFARRPVLAVVQTQPRLDLRLHPALDLPEVIADRSSRGRDKTAQDLQYLLQSSEELRSKEGYYPDVGEISGNVRRSQSDGAITLIDVMPIHADGGRLIGDKPSNWLGHIQDSLEKYAAFVGQFGG
jgi:hypothetical protein